MHFKFFIYLLICLHRIISRQIVSQIHTIEKLLTHNVNIRHVIVESEIYDYKQIDYRIAMQFGSNGQEFLITIDTGSSDLWVPGVGAQGFRKLKESQFFDWSKSDTFKPTKQQVSIFYGDGQIDGWIGFDQVCFGDPKIIIKQQSFEIITKAYDNMKNGNGIMGLSFQTLSRNQNPTMLNSMVAQNLIKKANFSLYLTDKGKHGSVIIFGGISQKYQQIPGSPFIYASIISRESYKIKLAGIAINDKFFDFDIALIDSGTSCLTIPSQLINHIKNEIQKSSGIQCEYLSESHTTIYSLIGCRFHIDQAKNITNILPIISIAITKQNQLKLTPEDYIFGKFYFTKYNKRMLEKQKKQTLNKLCYKTRTI